MNNYSYIYTKKVNTISLINWSYDAKFVNISINCIFMKLEAKILISFI
jgi:hypothetical protein